MVDEESVNSQDQYIELKARLADEFRKKVDEVKYDINIHFKKVLKDRKSFASQLLVELQKEHEE